MERVSFSFYILFLDCRSHFIRSLGNARESLASTSFFYIPTLDTSYFLFHVCLLIYFKFHVLFEKIFYRIISESPRWLFAKHKIDDGINCLKRIAKFNGKSFPEKFDISTSKNKESPFLELFTSVIYRKRLIIICLVW